LGELRPALAEAVAQVLDAAIFAGTAKPASWPAAIVPAAVTAGNVVEQGTATAAQGGIVGDLESTFDAVESDGFDVTGIAAISSLKGLLRKARDSTGQKLTDVSQDSFEGIGISYVMPGVMPTTPPTTAVSGDFTKAIIGVRRDLTYKLLDQAVLTDAAGLVIYNLPMQDMLALRLTARFAYATANPATRVGGSGFPFAVLQNATP
jgi:HK97 family phage major capsid protein